MLKTIMRIYIFLALLFLAACGEEPVQAPEDTADTQTPPPMVLKAVEYSALPGWGADLYADILPAFQKSCQRISRNDPEKPFGVLEQAGSFGRWQELCVELNDLAGLRENGSIQSFFEQNFIPYQILQGENPTGLFTGYYEASLKGSRTPTDKYNIPLHKRPDDLVMVDLGQFREHLKGERIAGRVEDGNLRPYETRDQIVTGQWPHNAAESVLVWVDNAVDAFFLQIQGSGRILLEDGGFMRVGYAGQNGHPYYAIGRELITRGYLTKENVSMQTIRQWLEAHPDQADEIMNTNKSYVFFTELTGDGPLGGENIALTPMRSLAIDRSLLPYGLPVWVDIEPPMEGAPALQRLMMAQDTGGAIRGAVRGDVFWGYGPEAELIAGNMKSEGRYWVLLPKPLLPQNP